MNHQDLMEYLSKIAERFLGDTDFFERNTHMHPIDRRPPEAFLGAVLYRFLVHLRHAEGDTPARGGSVTNIAALEWLVREARIFRTDAALADHLASLPADQPIVGASSQDGIDSILTGYINFVGMERCVDYAMYASDLSSPQRAA